MRAQETVVSRAGNEKYREEYERIFEKSPIHHIFTTEELTKDIPPGNGDLSGGMLSKE